MHKDIKKMINIPIDNYNIENFFYIIEKLSTYLMLLDNASKINFSGFFKKKIEELNVLIIYLKSDNSLTKSSQLKECHILELQKILLDFNVIYLSIIFNKTMSKSFFCDTESDLKNIETDEFYDCNDGDDDDYDDGYHQYLNFV